MIEPGFSEQPMYADDEIFYYIYEKCEQKDIDFLIFPEMLMTEDLH